MDRRVDRAARGDTPMYLAGSRGADFGHSRCC